MHAHYLFFLHLIFLDACIHVKDCIQHRDLYDFFCLKVESKVDFYIYIPVFKEMFHHNTYDTLFRQLTAPDTITTWNAEAVCVNTEVGR